MSIYFYKSCSHCRRMILDRRGYRQFVGTNVGIANKVGIDDAICQPYKVWATSKGFKG